MSETTLEQARAAVNGTGVETSYDLLIIGSGGAAMAAAIRGRDLGKRVLVVERGTLGGTCVNVGCIPSKSLLAQSWREDVSLAAALHVKDRLVDRLRASKYVDLLAAYGVEVKADDAEFLDPYTLRIGDEAVTAGAVLIASGARPSIPSIPGLEETGYLTSTTAMELSDAPRRLAVIGVNAVGLELGQMLGNFGSHVTFISRRDIAPYSEPEVSQVARDFLVDEGHDVLTDAVVTSVSLEDGSKVLRGRAADRSFVVAADEILVASGRTPNTESLGIARIGVETDTAGRILVDKHQRTSVPSVWAAGDVTDQPQYVYVAAAGGAAAAQNALGGGDEYLDFSALPRMIFTTPQIAAAGRTEAEAVQAGFQVETAVLQIEAVPRALVNADTRGLVKLVAEAGTRRLLGASVVADGAGEVIQTAVLAIDHGLTVGDLTSTWAPYLTMAEGLRLAAQTFERDVSRLSCCAA